MKITTYKVTCKKCSGSDVIKITDDRQVFYTNHIPIISARFRPDLKWGFECQCKNDSRVAPEEKDSLDQLVRNGSEDAIKAIAKSLVPHNERKFVIERV